jgi:hypothetical protein
MKTEIIKTEPGDSGEEGLVKAEGGGARGGGGGRGGGGLEHPVASARCVGCWLTGQGTGNSVNKADCDKKSLSW